VSRYQIEFFDNDVIGAFTRPHVNPVAFDRLADAAREAGDLIQNGVAHEVIVRDLWNMVFCSGSGAVALYMNFDVVAHIVSRDVEPRMTFDVNLLDVGVKV